MKTSNVDQVVDWLRSFVEGFDFTLPGFDQSLGRDLAHAAAGYIEQRSITQRKGATVVWAPNDPDYAEDKMDQYGWEEPNDRTGQMLSHESLFGQPEVTPRQVLMRYGTGRPPDRTYSPIDNRTAASRAADEAITDIEKAWFAHNVNDRPFYEVDAGLEEALIKVADDAMANYIQRYG